jgi:hypothetical protein
MFCKRIATIFIITLFFVTERLYSDDLEDYWNTISKHKFVIADFPKKPKELVPNNPQVIKLKDRKSMVAFQNYYIYIAGIEDYLLVDLFNSNGNLLDYYMRRPPKGAKFKLAPKEKHENEAIIILTFDDKEKKPKKWPVAFSRPSLKH